MSSLARYIYATIFGMLLLGGAFIGGCHYDRAKADAEAASVRAQDVQIARTMQPQIVTALASSQTLTKLLVRQVPDVNDHFIPAPGAGTVLRPAYYLTVGSVSLWNSAISPASAASTPGPATGPGAADASLLLSPISFDDAEANALINFGQYRECLIVARGWQDWYRKVSAVKP